MFILDVNIQTLHVLDRANSLNYEEDIFLSIENYKFSLLLCCFKIHEIVFVNRRLEIIWVRRIEIFSWIRSIFIRPVVYVEILSLLYRSFSCHLIICAINLS